MLVLLIKSCCMHTYINCWVVSFLKLFGRYFSSTMKNMIMETSVVKDISLILCQKMTVQKQIEP
jgi:hypothetical protein